MLLLQLVAVCLLLVAVGNGQPNINQVVGTFYTIFFYFSLLLSLLFHLTTTFHTFII